MLEQLQVSSFGPMFRTAVSVVSVPKWKISGSPAPAPPHVKRSIVLGHVRGFRPDTFVETGTYRGDTLAKIRPHVRRCLSIELDPTLAGNAQRRFERWPDVQVRVGDSAVVLPEIVRELTGATLFWLDGHYSGGVTADSGQSPIIQELEAILSSQLPIMILIDDARLFDGSDGYPTLAAILQLVAERRPDLHDKVEHDIVTISA